MKPVEQREFGEGKGDCFRACVASIFELLLDQVPHFCKGDADNWWDRLQKWLKPRGFCAVPICKDDTILKDLTGTSCILSGPTTRGILHSVVRHGDGLVWDPHPEHTGLTKVKDIILFVARDPSAFQFKRGRKRRGT